MSRVVKRLAARWVFPISSPPLRDGMVDVEHGRVLRVLPYAADSNTADSNTADSNTADSITADSNLGGGAIDCGDVALLPSLVNPHTHLEFSDLTRPLGEPGAPFPDWIRQVIRTRRASPSDAPARKSKAIVAGLTESQSCGVAALGEIVTTPCDLGDYRKNGHDIVAYHEVLANDPTRVPEIREQLESHYRECVRVGLRPAVSPHAPYTVSIPLFEMACDWATTRSVPLAFHFAESPEEMELLNSGDGPFADLLRDAKAWYPGQFGNRRPAEYLDRLATCPRVSVIHGNFM